MTHQLFPSGGNLLQVAEGRGGCGGSNSRTVPDDALWEDGSLKTPLLPHVALPPERCRIDHHALCEASNGLGVELVDLGIVELDPSEREVALEPIALHLERVLA
ncbi:MAG: hypothetical protein AAF533_20775 [Acidobacteriota bacterium]